MPVRRDLLLCGTLVLALTAICAAEEHKLTSSTELGTTSSTSPAMPQPSFLGLYAPDGNYKSLQANAKFLTRPQESLQDWRLRSASVPHFVNRHSSEAVIEDYAPPARPRRIMKAKSGLGSLRDRFINGIYGPDPVLLSPTLVATDSHQRLIVSDPVEPAIHVLSETDSFRIQGGQAYRLHHPVGIAVDSRDNIYVSDDQVGAILVYAPNGQFLRQLGTSHGESIFQTPTGIAIDRATDLIYVLDSPLNEIVILNPQGRVVKRIGGIHRRNTTASFDQPSAITVGSGAIVVLDTFNSRVQVLDLDGIPRNEFPVRPVRISPFSSSVGLALDKAGNIYTNHLEDSSVRIYTQSGELIGYLRGPNLPNARLASPTGICFDFTDRIFVADPASSSIQVFQMVPQIIAHHAERH